VPKSWVKKNNLQAKTEVNLVDHGKSLLISTEVQREELSKDIAINHNESEDAVLTMIACLYNEGYTRIKLKFDKECSETFKEGIERFLSQLFGIVVDKEHSSITISDSGDDKLCDELILKCFQNLLLLTEHIEKNKSTEKGWYTEVHESYQRIYFMSEYAIRLIHTKQSDLRQGIKWSITASTLQCLGFILKRIAEHKANDEEACKAKHEMHLDNLFCSVYDVCYKRKSLMIYFQTKAIYDNSFYTETDPFRQDIYTMFSYQCTKLVKLNSIRIKEPLSYTANEMPYKISP
jgi:hypothetical protein